METKWAWPLLRIAVGTVAGGYLLLLAAAHLLVDRALFHPDAGSRRAPDGLRTIRAADGNDIAVLHLPHPGARHTLWFFHGNAETLGDLEPFLHELRGRGFAVVAFDYPGYGRSTGRPTEASVHAAARAVGAWLREELGVPPERTLLYGRSLGGGPAVQQATEIRPAGLVLQAAFTSAFRVVTQRRILPGDRFDNLAKLPAVEAPVLVLHGTADEVIPFSHGERLLAAARGPARALWVPGAGHNDLIEVAGERYWTALRDFSAACAAPGAAAR